MHCQWHIIANLPDGIPVRGILFTNKNCFQENWEAGDTIWKEAIILYSWLEDCLFVVSEL